MGRIEDDLAEAIADAWGEIEKKAVAENSEETRKNEALILEWAKKLRDILQGRKN